MPLPPGASVGRRCCDLGEGSMIALPITATISPPAAMSSAVIGVLLRSWAFCLREGRSSSGHFDRTLGWHAVALFVPALGAGRPWCGVQARRPQQCALRNTGRPPAIPGKWQAGEAGQIRRSGLGHVARAPVINGGWEGVGSPVVRTPDGQPSRPVCRPEQPRPRSECRCRGRAPTPRNTSKHHRFRCR